MYAKLYLSTVSMHPEGLAVDRHNRTHDFYIQYTCREVQGTKIWLVQRPKVHTL